jgi:GT2 family glycosyltransferase
MKVYFVIVTYNGMQWIEKCLSSILKSSGIFEIKIILIDNCSSDSTVEFVQHNFSSVTVCKQNQNLGFGGANNIGIQKSFTDGADYVFLLNQDAWVQPTTISDLIAAHQLEPHFGVLSPIHLNGKGDALDYNFSTYIDARSCKGLISDTFLGSASKRTYEAEFINAAAWLVSRKCIERVGGFNPSFFHYGEDDNYIQRIKFHGFKVGVYPDAVVYHDREVDSKNKYFKDEKKIYRQSMILKISNPLQDYTFHKEYKKKIGLFFKSIILLRFYSAKRALCDILILNKLDKDYINANKAESCKIQPSFLQL